MTNKAGFTVRFLASLIDTFILFLPHLLFWVFVLSSQDLNQLVFRLALYLIIILLPFVIIGFLYPSLATAYFGATIGKFLTGLRVGILGDSDKKLTVKRAIFRQTIGFQFASLLFGLGFLSIIKDPQKQGWHDKTVNSQVVVVKKWWPVGLVSLVLLVIVNSLLVNQIIKNLRTNYPKYSSGIFAAKNQVDNSIPTTESECIASGGVWNTVDTSPTLRGCNIPTDDAGKICDDTGQCQGMCVADLTAPDLDRVRKGETLTASGTCSSWKINTGCIPRVDKGKVSFLCIY